VSVSFPAAQESNTAVYAAMKGAAKLRMVQTNFAGDAISIIDPATNKVVGEIPGIEMAHGINVAKDNSQIYVAQESTALLLVVDGKTLQITKRIPVSGSPNLRLSRAVALTLSTSLRSKRSRPSRSRAASTTCTSPRTANM